MTKHRFWKELDALTDNFDESETSRCEKLFKISLLLKQAYDEDLSIIMKCVFDPFRPGCAHQQFVETEEGRVYIFYTSNKKARANAYMDEYCEASLRDVINNIFNRDEACGIAFEDGENNIFIPLDCLGMFFTGEIPKPEDFVESKVGGWNPFVNP